MNLLSTAVYATTFAVFLHVLKNYMNGGVCLSEDRIDNKVVLITGANTGIGKETAADLALRGGKVYMGCRSIEKGRKAATDIQEKHPQIRKEQLHVVKLDLASLSSIRRFSKKFKSREDRLDILINNAGVMYVPQGTKTEDGFEATFGINHLGHFLLTVLLMDEIVSASPSRVVTVSSLAHKRGSGTIKLEDPMLTSEWSTVYAYAQSKLANILFSQELARRLEGTGVTTYSLHPGAVQTDLMRYVPGIGNPIGDMLFKFITWPFMKDPWHGAQTQICCAVDKSLKTQTGKYYADCQEKKPEAAGAFDDELLSQLWDLSVKLLKLEKDEIHEKLR